MGRRPSTSPEIRFEYLDQLLLVLNRVNDGQLSRGWVPPRICPARKRDPLCDKDLPRSIRFEGIRLHPVRLLDHLRLRLSSGLNNNRPVLLDSIANIEERANLLQRIANGLTTEAHIECAGVILIDHAEIQFGILSLQEIDQN